MNVSGINAAAAASTASTTDASKASVDYESFLKLLVAEMKHQDPTDPMDSAQYVAQLASFSQVEQSIQINTKLDNLLASSQLSQASSIIGKVLTSADGEITGTVAEVRLYSDGIVAVLENGTELLVEPGVKISDA